MIYVETTGNTHSVVHKVSFVLFEKTALVVVVETIALVVIKVGRMMGRNKSKRNGLYYNFGSSITSFKAFILYFLLQNEIKYLIFIGKFRENVAENTSNLI